MKIIFLDIDGVLNSNKSIIQFNENGYGGYFNDLPVKETIDPLNKLTDLTSAKIVISSTWRKLHNILSLSYIFYLCGIKAELIGVTPIVHNVQRGVEIKNWLESPSIIGGGVTEVTNFVILDDDSDMEPLMKHFVKIDNRVGLTFNDVNKAIKILNMEI